ncbi:LOW QUALITY PROTEIN: hypothetical protein MAR_001667, partial [Mya arenaria]
ANSKDPDHPDFIPSIFTRTPRSSVKGQKRMDRFNSSKRRWLYSNARPVSEPIDEIENTGMLNATRLQATKEAGSPHVETVLSHIANCIPPTPMSNKERSSLFTEIHNLREERDALKDRLVQEQSHKLCTNVIEDEDGKSRLYTGFTWAMFLQTFIFINDGLRPANVGSMPNKEQFFLTLVKLRQNPRFLNFERIIGIIKNRSAILQGTVPLHLVNSKISESGNGVTASVDLIVHACAIFTNLGEGIQN